MASRKSYVIDEDDLTDLLADLELLVVSLDWIGAASEDERKSVELGGRFLIDKAMLKRLTKARHTLSGVFDESASRAAVRRLEAKLARQKFWEERGLGVMSAFDDGVPAGDHQKTCSSGTDECATSPECRRAVLPGMPSAVIDGTSPSVDHQGE